MDRPGTLHILNLLTGKPVGASTLGKEKPIDAVAFSGVTSDVVLVTRDHDIWRWTPSAKNHARHVLKVEPSPFLSFHHGMAQMIGTLSRDGRFFAGRLPDRNLAIWRLADCKQVWSPGIEIHTPLTEAKFLTFLADGRRFVGTKRLFDIGIWDFSTGRPVESLPYHGKLISAITATPDGRMVAAAAPVPNRRTNIDTGRVTLWDLGAKQESHHFAVSGPATVMALSPDHRWLALGLKEGGLTVVQTQTGAAVYGLPDDIRATALAYSLNSRTLAVAARRESDLDGFVDLIEVATGRVRRHWGGHRGDILCVAFSADGRLLATGGMDTSVVVWQVLPGRLASGTTLGTQELARLWEELRGANAARAFTAIGRLASAPAETVPWLRAHLQPVDQADATKVATWLAELDDRDFATRQRATRHLSAVLESAAPTLRRALDQKLSPESRRRVAALLRQNTGWPPGTPADNGAITSCRHARPSWAKHTTIPSENGCRPAVRTWPSVPIIIGSG